jgi:cytidylate kinase
MKGLVITVSGPHGTGKSTYARALAEALGLRYVCAGELFRKLARENAMSLEAFSKYAADNATIDKLIDERTRAEAKKGNVVIDAQLGALLLKEDADIRLLLVAADEVRFRRIAARDRVSFETARRETLGREQIQRDRYKKYYDIDVTDQTVYNLKIDTGLDSIDGTKATILQEVLKLLNRQSSKLTR